MADAVGHERLLPGAVDAHGAAAHLRGAVGAQRLVQRILLVAEAAADIGLDNMDIRPRTAQRLSHHAADDMGDLGGGHHHDPAVLLIGEAAVLGAEPVVRCEGHKTAIAVSTVVIFGTIAMFLYPSLYRAGLFNMSDAQVAIYTGGTLHEVAHVAGAESVSCRI